MLSEVNQELYELCENAVSGIINGIIDKLCDCFAKLPVPKSWSDKGFNYTDFIAFRMGSCPLDRLSSVRAQAYEGIRLEMNRLTPSDHFTLAAYFIEQREQMARHSDDPSAEADVPENPIPSNDEIITHILDCWEDWLYDRYEEVQPEVTEADAVTVIEGRKPVYCPHCGGRMVPIVYGEPSEELWKKAEAGEVALGGCLIDVEGNPEWECNKCGQWFSRK